MDLLWPGALFLLALIPILIGLYIWVLRRRKPVAVRYSSLSLVRDALPKQSRWRRHVPFALFMLALAGLIVALSRPVAVVTVPTGQTSIIMTIDVSRSMLQSDIVPTRLEAAQQAANGFIQNQKATTQIGIVAFAGFAELIQQPTNDQEALEAAIDSLTTGRRTAIGSGILKAIDTIAEIDSSVAPSTEDGTSQTVPPVAAGAYVPDIIVVLTDGVSNAGPDPLDAAQQAADRGIRVYTIGYGTATGSPDFDPFFGGGGGGGGGGPDPFGGGGGGNGFFGGGGQGFGSFQRGIDEATLKQVADMTGGQYYSASSAAELQSVFENLPTYLIVKHETLEISVAFAIVGALAAVLAILLALRWQPLP